MSNITNVFTGSLPLDAKALSDQRRAFAARSAVSEVGQRMQALDQVDGIDLSKDKGNVDVSNAKLPGATGLVNSFVPEKVTGFAQYGEDGGLKELYTSSKELTGTKELQYQLNKDGSQTYAVTTPTGQTTVRENADGTLFMMESPKPSTDDWKAMTSLDFVGPAPGQQPITAGEAWDKGKVAAGDAWDKGKNAYVNRAQEQMGAVNDILNGNNPKEAAKKLFGSIFKLNPFS